MLEWNLQNNRWLKNISLGLICLVSTACAPQSDTSVQYYKLIINGRVLDGTGDSWYSGNIAGNDDKTAKVGDLEDAAARDTIDAEGLYVTPGFIDVHSHAASRLSKPELSDAKPLLLQGI